MFIELPPKRRLKAKKSINFFILFFLKYPLAEQKIPLSASEKEKKYLLKNKQSKHSSINHETKPFRWSSI